MACMQFRGQRRSQDLFSSGANVVRVNQAGIEARSAEYARCVHRGAMRAPSPREARDRSAKRRVKSVGGVWGGGSVSLSPINFLKF